MFVALQRLTPPLPPTPETLLFSRVSVFSTAAGFVEIVGTISTACVAHRTHFSWLTQLLKRHRGDAHRKQSAKTAFVFAISNRDENCRYRFLQHAEKRQFRTIFVLVQSGKMFVSLLRSLCSLRIPFPRSAGMFVALQRLMSICVIFVGDLYRMWGGVLKFLQKL